MTSPILTAGSDLETYALLDRYVRQSGRVFLTGTQALVRIATATAPMG
jgi:indolepyruvate ferredoxin oxidoreductase